MPHEQRICGAKPSFFSITAPPRALSRSREAIVLSQRGQVIGTALVDLTVGLTCLRLGFLDGEDRKSVV